LNLKTLLKKSVYLFDTTPQTLFNQLNMVKTIVEKRKNISLITGFRLSKRY